MSRKASKCITLFTSKTISLAYNRMLVLHIKINWLIIVINLFIYKLTNHIVVILNILKAVAFIHSAHTHHTQVLT